MPNSAIWVVVANDNDAAICASSNGTSQLLRVVTRRGPFQAASPDGREDFARQIVSELLRAAQDGAYEGIVLIADRPLMDEIDRVALPQVRSLVIAQIVETAPPSLPPMKAVS